MRSRILVLTENDDAHAYAVYLGLLHKGADPVLWHTIDFPIAETESIWLSGDDMALSIRSPRVNLSDQAFKSVWRRRPSQGLDPRLHPDDRDFARAECRSFRQSLLCLLAPDAFWINPPAAAMMGSRKPVQLRLAQSLGATVPQTLFTNDPKAIRTFIRRHGGQIVFKVLNGVSWHEQGSSWAPYTTLLREEDLIEDFLLQTTPGIYQELLAKDFELRVTVMGNRVFAAKIRSQETVEGKLDWRRAYDELVMEPYSLPSSVEKLCRQMVRRLGFVFGCLDFIVTPSGEHVFLEVNEMGQFLFVERYTGIPLLDAFCEFLLQGRADFKWRTRREAIRYADLEPKLEELSQSLGIAKEQPPDVPPAAEAGL